GRQIRRSVHAATLGHDPEKWIPVFRKDHAQIKEERATIDSIPTNLSLAQRAATSAPSHSMPAAPALCTTLPQSTTSRATNLESSAGEVGAPGVSPMSISFFWPSA